MRPRKRLQCEIFVKARKMDCQIIDFTRAMDYNKTQF